MMLDALAQAGRYLGQSMRLMVGLPEYDTYVAHMEKTHPDQPVMSYEEFSASARKRGTVAASAGVVAELALLP